MQQKWAKRTAGIVGAAFLLAGVLWFAWPRPIQVDIATLGKGPMQVTVDDEGKTHLRHVYTVSAPILGKVLRISHPSGHESVSLHVGDHVKANETIIAIMQPTSPGFIDARSREELKAAVATADAAVVLAEAEIRRVQAALDFSRDELRRSEALSKTGTIAAKALEKACLTSRQARRRSRVPRRSSKFVAANAQMSRRDSSTQATKRP